MASTLRNELFFAHSKGASGNWQTMQEHVSHVSAMAAEFADAFGCADEARIAGVLHDIGKYSELFQDRLHGHGKGLDHWSMGAWAALQVTRRLNAALAIQGHHIGLQQMNKESLSLLAPKKLAKQDPREGIVTCTDLEALLVRLAADGFVVESNNDDVCLPDPSVGGMLDTRMLFSCLVDADYLDTAAHFDGDTEHAVPELNADLALQLLTAYVNSLSEGAAANPLLAELRQAVWHSCLEEASRPPGPFTLSAPTGSGKTLAMMGFALKHAAANGLRRVVIVLPYLNIIEQTAAQYRAIFDPVFGSNYILEHHSLTPFEANTHQDQDDAGEGMGFARLQAENWDAPIVVTTTVQLLESLFANRPAACRKLHRLAQSVVIFDEAQALPQKLILPTLAALSRLAQGAYGSSVVFATATQPAFGHLNDKLAAGKEATWHAQEIVAPRVHNAFGLQRTVVEWPATGEKLTIDELAQLVVNHRQALCIVNTRKAAGELARRLQQVACHPGAVRHLSTSMCPQHRKDVLQQVRNSLVNGEPILLVATQCVEAGVDIDFPAVYRAFAPLDAVIQAAGRCNRNGRMVSPGTVRVFNLDDEHYPDAAYKQATEVTRSLLAMNGGEIPHIEDPAIVEKYCLELYDLNRPEKRAEGLVEAIRSGDFNSVASEYKVIQDNAINVLVPYRPLFQEFEPLLDRANERGIDRLWLRKASPLSAGMYLPIDREHPAHAALVQLQFTQRYRAGELAPFWYAMLNERHYSDLLGIDVTDAEGGFIV